MSTVICPEAGIIRDISPEEEMFSSNESHYFSVGHSALDCIHIALRAAKKTPLEVKHILDLPCGHGRVLRYLKSAFPEATITACDLLRSGVDYCAATFGALPVYSHEEPSQIPLPHSTFDLIWVGSLFTHFDSDYWHEFLRVFRSFLRPGGLLVFSTHGRKAHANMKNGNAYGVSEGTKTSCLNQYRRCGFGYGKYAGSENTYGISMSHPAWVLKQIARLNELRVVHFSEAAWDNHQDCFACLRDPAWR